MMGLDFCLQGHSTVAECYCLEKFDDYRHRNHGLLTMGFLIKLFNSDDLNAVFHGLQS